jgi:hypothetical protein
MSVIRCVLCRCYFVTANSYLSHKCKGVHK